MIALSFFSCQKNDSQNVIKKVSDKNDTLKKHKSQIIEKVLQKSDHEINSVVQNKKYSAEGTWMVDCKKGVGSLSISGKEASLILLYNQIYIDMSELKRYDYEKGIAYTLKEIPEDIGEIGRGLNWKEYMNNEPIAYIKMINDNTMYFYWYGFYNKKTKKREFKETNFQQESNAEEIILRKCNQ
ncbi:hypothetical protein RM51_16320 [Chryseobacterium taiwanense]|uniref:Uncharacterized protein n=1 Tax=Chryseobacterium taiwanense TaxID=363331 RepID=A0A0B4E4M5_9FLAO|nr:hypothetical protein RM51_16320 [Chryseobacterium taiwanense]